MEAGYCIYPLGSGPSSTFKYAFFLDRLRFPCRRVPNAAANYICQARGLVARRGKWLTPTLIVALVAAIFPEIPWIISYSQQSAVVYSTNELTTYPVPYHDNRFFPGDIQGRMLASGPIKIVSVVVQNTGQRSASGVVRIPRSASDEYLVGWVRRSEDPSRLYMLGTWPEYKYNDLMPGDTITIYLWVRNANSELASRIGVFERDGRRAGYYPYVPVRYVGGDVVATVPIRMRWIYACAFMLIVGLILGVSRMRNPRQPSDSADRQSPADRREPLPASSPGSTLPNQESRDSLPSDRVAGGR